MGSGSIPKLMLNLAIPAVVAQLINMLYNIVDRIYIGHIPDAGASALTGVGLFLPILMMINAFAMLRGDERVQTHHDHHEDDSQDIDPGVGQGVGQRHVAGAEEPEQLFAYYVNRFI